MKNVELAVIGGGPAGLAAAYAAFEKGIKDIVIFERSKELGGILNQCIHNGFGLHYFKEELTGPEYAEKWMALISQTTIQVETDTMIVEISPNKEIVAIHGEKGKTNYQAQAIILAMGCRERTRGAISIVGDRPAGVWTAGTAQYYINQKGYQVGQRVVILGSGDIGLIMARRMVLEGAKVLGVIELMPYSNGLTRNIVQCLEDYNIPLYLSHTITRVVGRKRLEAVEVCRVDDERRPISETCFTIPCDTLLLSVGLIPENELTQQMGIGLDPRTRGALVYEDMQTEAEGVFACGNVLHVHDLVDFVTEEGIRAGQAAARYIQSPYSHNEEAVVIKNGKGMSYTVPQRFLYHQVEQKLQVLFRVSQVYGPCKIEIKVDDQVILSLKKERLLPAEMEKVLIPKVKIPLNSTMIELVVKELQ